MQEPQNKFSLKYYESIIKYALDHDYKFITMRDFFNNPDITKTQKIAIMRHDLDEKPARLPGIIAIEKKLGIKSTVFVLLHTDRYNVFSHNVLSMLRNIESDGFEIGIHTNFLEVAMIIGCDPNRLLKSEVKALKAYFNISGIACHRNIDFMYNSLPHLQENWPSLQKELDVEYEAYSDILFSRLVFVNEGFKPHVTWRDLSPENVIESGNNFCLSTHPHWWHKTHPFEN
jgi:hypothetical protein